MTPVTEDRRTVELEDAGRRLILERPAGGDLQPASASQTAPSEVLTERASMEERMLYALEERLAELDMRLREQIEADQVRELEFRAMERDLALKDAYVTKLETERETMHAQLGQAFAHRDELFVALEATRSELAEVAATSAAIQSQLSYRASRKIAAVLRDNTGPLYGLLKAALRAAAH